MNTNYKRQYRQLSDETKKKIQASSTGKPKTAMHRQHISQAMREYWQGVPNKPQATTMDSLIGARNNESSNQSNDETSM